MYSLVIWYNFHSYEIWYFKCSRLDAILKKEMTYDGNNIFT